MSNLWEKIKQRLGREMEVEPDKVEKNPIPAKPPPPKPAPPKAVTPSRTASKKRKKT